MSIKKLNISDYKEIATLLTGLSGVDFSGFALSFARKRLENTINALGASSIGEFKNKLIAKPSFFETVIYKMSPPVTELFRAPEFWITLEQEILPKLNKKEAPKICVPQCASGDELYSLLILLKRNNMLQKSQVTAYDFSNKNIAIIKAGIYPIKKLTQSKKNYAILAPQQELTAFCSLSETTYTLNNALLENVDLQVRTIFDDNTGEYDFILFRNRLIYMGKELHNKTLSHLHRRLPRGGIFAIGSKESITGNSDLKFFKASKTEKIYRKGRF